MKISQAQLKLIKDGGASVRGERVPEPAPEIAPPPVQDAASPEVVKAARELSLAAMIAADQMGAMAKAIASKPTTKSYKFDFTRDKNGMIASAVVTLVAPQGDDDA